MLLKLRQMFQNIAKRLLLRMVDIPSLDEFSSDDQKEINDWLLFSSGHKGFYKYLQARDRACAQTMVNLNIRDESDSYIGLSARRLEIARLKARAERIKMKKNSESS